MNTSNETAKPLLAEVIAYMETYGSERKPAEITAFHDKMDKLETMGFIFEWSPLERARNIKEAENDPAKARDRVVSILH